MTCNIKIPAWEPYLVRTRALAEVLPTICERGLRDRESLTAATKETIRDDMEHIKRGLGIDRLRAIAYPGHTGSHVRLEFFDPFRSRWRAADEWWDDVAGNEHLLELHQALTVIFTALGGLCNSIVV